MLEWAICANNAALDTSEPKIIAPSLFMTDEIPFEFLPVPDEAAFRSEAAKFCDVMNRQNDWVNSGSKNGWNIVL